MFVVAILLASGIFRSAISRPSCQSAFDNERHVLRKLVEFMDSIFITQGSIEGTESSDSTCPDMWVPFKGSCYLFGNQIMTYSEAEQFCKQYNSYLVHVDDVHENNFLRDMVINRLKERDWWIGLTDRVNEGQWKWVDTDTSPNFTDWQPGQPNGGNKQSCAKLYASFSFHWADLPCSDKEAAICEKR